VETGGAARVVRVCTAIGNDGKGIGHSFESVPDFGRNDDQTVVVGTQEYLHDLALARRPGPLVIKRQLDAPEGTGIVECHLMMPMPTLDHAAIDRREIDLPNCSKCGSVARRICLTVPRSSEKSWQGATW